MYLKDNLICTNGNSVCLWVVFMGAHSSDQTLALNEGTFFCERELHLIPNLQRQIENSTGGGGGAEQRIIFLWEKEEEARVSSPPFWYCQWALQTCSQHSLTFLPSSSNSRPLRVFKPMNQTYTGRIAYRALVKPLAFGYN